MLIAHHLGSDGDTLALLQPVLDTNFWLATHVTCVTLGYTATFLAGFLGILYVLLGVFTPQLKGDMDSMGAEILTQAAEWTPANVIKLAAQFINNSRRFNLIVTNVPGPPIAFYLLGSRMVAGYPHLPLFENQGLGVALFSYAGTLYWGVGADWNQMPDLREFMDGLKASFDDLCAAADPLDVPADRAAALPEPRAPKKPPLTVHRGSGVTLSADSAGARGTRARTRAASAADAPRHASPGPRLDTARSSRSTGRPGAQH
jgi:hypothetical protein